MKTPPNKTTHAHHPTKSIRVLFQIVTGGCLLGALPVSAQYQQFAFPEIAATIRSDDSNVDEAAAGYQMVKYNTGTSARKAYYQFAIPATANTNNGLDLNFTTAANSRAQHVQVWGLDQAYVGGLNTDIIWSTAQANQADQTLDNGMLTSGPFTATPLYDFISVNSAGTPFTVHIPAPWGAHLIGGKLILALATIDDPVNNANGLRLANGSGSLLYWELGLGAPPSLGAIGDLAALTGKPSTTNSFTVNDPEDGPNALTPTAVSSDEGVVPSANVVFGGSGADRTVYVVGGTNAGTAEIIVTVTDANGNAAERFFRVIVQPSNEAPVVSDIAPAHTLLNTAVAVPFTVEDDGQRRQRSWGGHPERERLGQQDLHGFLRGHGAAHGGYGLLRPV